MLSEMLMKVPRPAVFLDRDGVLNEAVIRNGRPYPPSSVEELKVFPDSGPALRLLANAGFILLVVSNQPDVARGTQTREAVQQINDVLAARLPIQEFFVCCHDDRDACSCRKPKPGLLLEAAGKYSIDLTRSFLIGDRWRDIDAGAAAGCRTILLDRHYNERLPEHPPDAQTGCLGDAANWIIANR
jgi:D-glycero-D-manno-heptose 1,7-bisphosphate phosphatase